MTCVLKVLLIVCMCAGLCSQLEAQEVSEFFPDFPVERLNTIKDAGDLILPFVYKGYVYVFSLEQEILLWRIFIGGDLANPFIVDRDTLYLYDVYNRVYSIDMRGGKIRWKVDLRQVIRGKPCVHQDTLILATQKGIIYVIDSESGRITDEYKGEGEISSGLNVYEDLMIVAYKSGRVVAYDIETKKPHWKFACKGIISIRPVVQDGFVFFGAWDDTFYVLHAEDGSPLWDSYVGENISREFLVFDDEIVLFFTKGEILTLNRRNGEIKWVKYFKGIEFNYNYFPGREKCFIFVPELLAINLEDGSILFNYRERAFFFYKEMLFENMIAGKVRLNDEDRVRLLGEKYFTISGYPFLPPLSAGEKYVYFVADNSFLYVYNLKEDFFIIKYKIG